MTLMDSNPRSRGVIRPRFVQNFRALKSEGAGNAGRSMRPQPRTQNKKRTSVVTTVTPERPGIPRAMVLRLTSRSPRRSGLLSPSSALLLADLTPALGRQNDTTSPSASAPFVTCAARVHRIPPRVRDVRNAPLLGQDALDMHLIWVRPKQKYFCKGGWTGHFGKHEVICPSGKISTAAGLSATKSRSKWEIEMDDRTVRVALERHWDASDASDFKVEHEIYREDAVLDYPQSGERIRGRHNIQESRFVQPNKKRFTVLRIIGSGDLWVTEFVLTYDGIPSYAV